MGKHKRKTFPRYITARAVAAATGVSVRTAGRAIRDVQAEEARLIAAGIDPIAHHRAKFGIVASGQVAVPTTGRATKTKPPKSHKVNLRVSASWKRQAQERARRLDLSLSQFVRNQAILHTAASGQDAVPTTGGKPCSIRIRVPAWWVREVREAAGKRGLSLSAYVRAAVAA